MAKGEKLEKGEEPVFIRDEDRKVFGPCGSCAFYRDDETPAQHTTGRCHGAPPHPTGWPVVQASFVGCAVFRPAGR